MKRFIQILVVIIVFVFNSCEIEPLSRVGFNSSIGKDSSGLTILDVKSNNEPVFLVGTMVITEGIVEVELINPEGIAIYSKRFQSSASSKIDESFHAVPGYWKLKYKSYQGVGNIDLHLNF